MRLIELLWLLLPPGSEILVIVAVGFVLILGIFNRQRAFAVLGSLAVFLVIEAIVMSLLAGIPLWVQLAFDAFMVVLLIGAIGRTYEQ